MPPKWLSLQRKARRFEARRWQQQAIPAGICLSGWGQNLRASYVEPALNRDMPRGLKPYVPHGSEPPEKLQSARLVLRFPVAALPEGLRLHSHHFIDLAASAKMATLSSALALRDDPESLTVQTLLAPQSGGGAAPLRK
jgi:hypothetical protein